MEEIFQKHVVLMVITNDDGNRIEPSQILKATVCRKQTELGNKIVHTQTVGTVSIYFVDSA